MQAGATIIKPILDGHVDALSALLQSIGNDIKGNKWIPFALLPTVHFMSWFIIETDSCGACLVLEINIDGPIGSSLKDLAEKAEAGLNQIYLHCQGYAGPGTNRGTAIVDYLLRDDAGYDCFYVGWQGFTVSRINRERDLRARLESTLDEIGDAAICSLSPTEVRHRLQFYINGEPSLAWAKTFPPRPFFVRYSKQVAMWAGPVALISAVVIAFALWRWCGPWPDLLILGMTVALVALFVLVLWWHEITDPVAAAEPDHSSVESIVQHENMVIQNHMVSVADVKPGLFRWLVLKTVLKLIQLLAVTVSNHGSLSGISTIHFARWLVIDKGRKLLFLSNYDGSWENYLDDFIDRASSGLTAIWSNSVGFPRTQWLVYGGARDELLFKTLVRKSQVPSLVWYSAYPDLSAENIASNAAIREGLFAEMDKDSEMAWLKLF